MGKKKVKEEESSSILKCNADEVFSDSEGEEKHVTRKKIEHHKKKPESSSEEEVDENVSEDEQVDKKINGHHESSSSSSESEGEAIETEPKMEKQESVSEVSKNLEPGFSKVSVVHRWVGSLEEFSKKSRKSNFTIE